MALTLVHFISSNKPDRDSSVPKADTIHKKSNKIYVFQCSEELYIGETKQPLPRGMYQHRKSSVSGPELDQQCNFT